MGSARRSSATPTRPGPGPRLPGLGRLVLHQLLPVDDAVAGGAGLDGDAALEHVVELRGDVHVAALTGPVPHADHGQAAAHADAAVALEHLGLDRCGELVALAAEIGDLALDLGHAGAGGVAVLGDRV